MLFLDTYLRRAQILPEISADPSVTVINFCRTPQWYSPRVSILLLNGRYSYPQGYSPTIGIPHG
jgi:hypothetical protein